MTKNCIKKKNGVKSRNPRGRPIEPIITPERETWVFERRLEGMHFETMAEEFEKVFDVSISFHRLSQLITDNPERWKDYLSKLQDLRLANRKARISDLQKIADKLKEKIEDALDSMPPRQFKEMGLAELIREHSNLLARIQDECGEKIHKFAGEGNNSIIFGDVIVNQIAEQTLSARKVELAEGNGSQKNRFFDPRSSLSNN